jgi:hypothetical protein
MHVTHALSARSELRRYGWICTGCGRPLERMLAVSYDRDRCRCGRLTTHARWGRLGSGLCLPSGA